MNLLHKPARNSLALALARILAVVGVSAALIVAVVARQPKELDARGADPTFAEDIAPIVFKNCTSCHRSGGLAPFSLLDYDSAAAYLDEMRDMVSTGQMPPWQADGPRGVFRNDRRLSDADRQTILRWLETGAKPGDMKKLPPQPQYPTGWDIGEPDLIVRMAADYTVPASGTVEYQYFEVPTNLTEEKWVQAIEIMPGSREVVHHVLVYARVPRAPGAALRRLQRRCRPGHHSRRRSSSAIARTPSRRTRRVAIRSIRRRGRWALSSAAPRPAPTSWSFPPAPRCGSAPAPCSRSRCTTRRTATKRRIAAPSDSVSRRRCRTRRFTPPRSRMGRSPFPPVRRTWRCPRSLA